jgi:hypothetical protein
MGARIGVLLTRLLGKLMRLDYDLDGVVDALDGVMRRMPFPHHLRLARYLELLLDGEEGHSSEKDALAGELFFLIRRAGFMTASAGSDEMRLAAQAYGEALGRLVEALRQVADDLEYLALRHFYSALRRGQYRSLRALLYGSSLIRRAVTLIVAEDLAGATLAEAIGTNGTQGESAGAYTAFPGGNAGGFMFGLAASAAAGSRDADAIPGRFPDTADGNATGDADRLPDDWTEIVDEHWLLDFGEGFDFRTFDDDNDVLLPQVVDMLYPDF